MRAAGVQSIEPLGVFDAMHETEPEKEILAAIDSDGVAKGSLGGFTGRQGEKRTFGRRISSHLLRSLSGNLKYSSFRGSGAAPRARNPGTQASATLGTACVHRFRAWSCGPSRNDEEVSATKGIS
jgi:hypothetical protein